MIEMTEALSEYIKSKVQIKPNQQRVSKEEFETFIKAYPHKLDVDCCGIWEPPLITYNDFALGYWPLSMVASTYAYDDKPGDYYYEPPNQRTYLILKNFEEIYKETQRIVEEYLK